MSLWLVSVLPLVVLGIVLLFGFSGCLLTTETIYYRRASALRLTLHRPRHTRVGSVEFTFNYGSGSSMFTDTVSLTFDTVTITGSSRTTYTATVAFVLEREDTEFTVTASGFAGQGPSSVSARFVYADAALSPISSDPVSITGTTTVVEWEVLPAPAAGAPPPPQTVTQRPAMTMPMAAPPRLTFRVRNQRGVAAVNYVFFDLEATPAGGAPQTFRTRLRQLDWFDTPALTDTPVGLVGGRIDVTLAAAAPNSRDQYTLFVRPLPPDTGWPVPGAWRVVPSVGDPAGGPDVAGPEATFTVPPATGDSLEVNWDVPPGGGGLTLVRS